MDNSQIQKELENQRAMIEKIYISVEKTRKYFLWTMIITIAIIVLPFIAMIAIIPMIMNSISTLIGGMSIGI